MGWLTLQQLDSSSLKPGQTVQLRLASQAISSQTGARIDVSSWVAGVDPIFVGFRTAERGDRGLSAGAAGRVHVYTAPTSHTFDSRPTLWKAGLEGEAWARSVHWQLVAAVGAKRGLARKGCSHVCHASQVACPCLQPASPGRSLLRGWWCGTRAPTAAWRWSACAAAAARKP